MRKTAYLLSLALILALIASLTSSAAVHIGSLDDVLIATKRPTMATGPPGMLIMFQKAQEMQTTTQFDSSPMIKAHQVLGEGPHTFTAMIEEQTTLTRLQESRVYVDTYRLARDGI